MKTLDVVGIEGTESEATGFVFGSKNLSFTNILRWWNLKDESLCLSMDYVHNICSNGWSMGTIGTTVYKDSIYLQSSFMPLCYSFTRSESYLVFTTFYLAILSFLLNTK